ncbi:MAG: diguanylate cyclase [Desulfobacteraceae bacterium]|nr:diguanylate cyclase [Desulfobacteraceae bacterium]
MEIPGYTISGLIDETQHSAVYSGKKNDTGQPVIIKTIRETFPGFSETTRIRREYELLGKLDIEGVVKVIETIDTGDSTALVMEDFGGVSLKCLAGAPFEIGNFLVFAARLARTLDALHSHNISHRDIKPGNILYNSGTDELKFTDFGTATELSLEEELVYNPRLIEGTLAYMSPEQTGRMNCDVDYRADFYSLGATFYEMLTGNPPFSSGEPMDIIHAHIARKPVPPHIIRPEVPEVVSNIVMKLLEKGPQERYQSASGLAADLEECQRQLEASCSIENFELGKSDFPLKFTMPRELVGREKEFARLTEAFERTFEGSAEAVLVTGEPGIGKSALVYEMDRIVTARHSFFISGKYDQLRSHVPYSAIIQAYQGLIKSLLAESDEKIREWKEKLLSALGSNARVIIDIIPELALITGPQPEVPELGPAEARNRFRRVFGKFVSVFADSTHPLVLFLDDMQWADPASIELLKNMSADGGLGFFLFIGAFRDKEVPEHHPLMPAVEKISRAGINIDMIDLQALEVSETNRLLSDFLRCSPEITAPLAEVVQAKTFGNPFFVTQFLKTLYENRELVLDSSGVWQWGHDSVRSRQITENVVDFMAEKIRRLPAESMEVIKICACIGNRFDVRNLAEVAQKPADDMVEVMEFLFEEGFFTRRGLFYAFQHDRIQEAAYSLVPGEQRALLHYRIGTLALENTPEGELFEKVFYIADQLNLAAEVMTSAHERRKTAGLNLQAGRKAKDSAAYNSAAGYLSAGMGFLPKDSWHTDYRLTYDLYTELMECRYLTREFEEAERLFGIITENAATRADRANAYALMIVMYTNMRSPWDAIGLGLKALRLFGLRVPEKPGTTRVLQELAKVRLRLAGMQPEEILNLPMMEDQDRIACNNILISMGTSAYYVSPKLFAVLTLISVNDILKYGLTEGSPAVFVDLATIIENLLADYRLGYRIGEVSLKLNKRLENKRIAGVVDHIFAFFIQHWKKHAGHDIEVYKKVYELCLDSGNFIFAGHSINAAADCRLMIGRRLDDILEESLKYGDFISHHVKDPFIDARYRENIQLIRCLKGLTESRTSLSGDGFDHDRHLSRLHREKNYFGVCFALLYREKLLYLYGKYEKALKTAEKLDQYIHVPAGTLVVPEHYFYRCLINTALMLSGARREKSGRLRVIKKYLGRLKKFAELCPENFRHKYELVLAEREAAKGRLINALRLYHSAADGARRNGYVNEQAIACERTAVFYQNIGAEQEAEVFLQKAKECYRIWGASAKEQEIKERQSLPVAESKQESTENRRSTRQSSDTGTGHLDLTTVMKASQAISSEIVLDSLLQNIMQISVVNAGAQRGFLILETDGRPAIVAAEDTKRRDIVVSKALEIDKCEDIAVSIVNYVWRSHESVILANACEKGAFKNDPYIRENLCRSVLCMPILNKGRLTGVLYMENNLTPNAFTEERLEILGAIVSQAAISIENARLFEQATTDGLTRLYVHRYFHFLLEKELERSRRYGRPCSLLIMDIDDFKHFNDTHGHQPGDEVLKQVADAIRKNTRTSDIAARYGGEEFVLVLPETDIDEAVVVAGKIRVLVENIKIETREPARGVTISIGAAVCPAHAQNKDELISAADKALYVSKRSGKNRVSVSHA